MNARIAFFGAVVCIAALAACGGGGGSGYTPPTPKPSPTSAATSAAFSTSATTAVTFPTLSNGISAGLTLPVANTAATANLSYEVSTPSGVAVPAMATLKKREAIGGSNLTTLGIISLSVGSNVVVSSTLAFTFTLASAVSGDAYIAYFDEAAPSNGWNVLLGPGVASGSTITFAAQPVVPPVTFLKGDTYLFALVTSSSAISAQPAAVYSGTKTVDTTYQFAFEYPTPGPTASPLPTIPPSNTTFTVTADVSTGSSPFPGPTASVSPIDEHVSETDATSLSTAQYVTDEWASLDSSYKLYLLGSLQQESSSANTPQTTTVYTTPQLLDQFPESAATWSTNSPAASVTYSYANGDNGTRAIAANGTYVDTENILGSSGYTAVTTENADGSGSIVAPFYGGYYTELDLAAPVSGNIAAQFVLYNSTDSPFTIPLWYPATPVFYTETDAVTTGVSLPAGCSPNDFGTTGNDVKRTITTLDTVIGYQETTTFDSYDVGGYPICLTTNDNLQYAYDEQGDNPYSLLYGPLGLITTTTTETLILQGGATNGAIPAAARRASTATLPQAGSATIAALENHQLNGFVRERMKHTNALLRAFFVKNGAQQATQGGIR